MLIVGQFCLISEETDSEAEDINANQGPRSSSFVYLTLREEVHKHAGQSKRKTFRSHFVIFQRFLKNQKKGEKDSLFPPPPKNQMLS